VAQIHPTALVDPRAELDSTVEVGPYTLIGPHVKIGAGTRIASHCVIEGHTTIGRDNRVFQFVSLGSDNQDRKYKGEPCELVIGDRNTIREYSTYHIGTVQGGGMTRLGTTTGSWPTPIWRMTAWSATTASSPTMPSLRVTSS